MINNCRIELGDIFVSRLSYEFLKFVRVKVDDYLTRHSLCDWGILSEEDKQINRNNLQVGERILSVFSIYNKRFMIITNPKIQTTIVILEDEAKKVFKEHNTPSISYRTV